MLCSEGIGFGQGLSSQHEGDRIVIRRVDAAVYVARTRPQWPANERPINPAAPFKQAVCWRGRGVARGGQCILKPSVRQRQCYWLSRSVQVEVACNNDGAIRIAAGRIRQDLVQLRNAQRIVSTAFKMKVVDHDLAAGNIDLRYQ